MGTYFRADSGGQKQPPKKAVNAMGQLFLLLAGALAILLIPLIIGIFVFRAAPWRKKERRGADFGKAYAINIFSYESDIMDMRDIFARQMSIYRDTGRISAIGDEEPVYTGLYECTADSLKELGMIIRCAVEVKRVSADEVFYFFNSIKALKIKTKQAREIYRTLSEGLALDHAMLLQERVEAAE
jgi:hypothetical protein